MIMKGNELLNKPRENVCVVEGEMSQKAVFVLLRLPSAIIESACQSEVCAELWEQEKAASSARMGLDEPHLRAIISTLLLHC